MQSMKKTEAPGAAIFRRDFTLVVVGQIISLFGNAILRFALPLYLLRATGSSALFGMVTAASFLPMIVLSLLGGVLADRVNKRNIMVALDFSTAALIAVFYLVLGRLPIVPLFTVMLMLLYGISGAYQPAVQASIPALVEGGGLMSANAVINAVNSLAGLLGPVLGGVLYGLWGIGPILLVSILCFFASAVMEVFIRIPHQPRAGGGGVFACVRGDLAESMRFVRREKPVFLKVIGIVAVFNLLLSSMMVVGVPVLVVKLLGRSDGELGLTQGALALGGLAGGLLAGLLGARLKMARAHRLLFLCALSVAGMGAALGLGAPAFAGYLIVTLLSFFAMAVSTMFSVEMITVVQAGTPPQLVGKVMACLMTLAMCAQPVGQALYGVLFERFEAAAWAILLAAALAAALLALCSKRVFRRL